MGTTDPSYFVTSLTAYYSCPDIKYKTVYFAPDRTSTEREEHIKLFEELKRLVVVASGSYSDPAKRYSIKMGKLLVLIRMRSKILCI